MDLSKKSLWGFHVLMLCFVRALLNFNGVVKSALLLCFLGALLNVNGGAEAITEFYPNLQSVCPAAIGSQLHRTAYHFQPTNNWMNDPNGPMYYNGIYHLFYQFNLEGPKWGNIVWAHSVSKDLINWKILPVAIYPSRPFDQYGCWSGSATILPGNKPIILYTGIIDTKKTQVQNYAIPANLSDPFLQKWVKPDNNPLIVADHTIDKTAFRDPTTGWLGQDGDWRITIGGRRGTMGISYLYKSKDFMHWVKVDTPLHYGNGMGLWECVDFYPVSVLGENGLDTSVIGSSVKHVLKVSLDVNNYDYYTIGTYYLEDDVYIPDEGMIDGCNGLRYDYGNFYASKSFFDPSTDRRIVWGWANESDSDFVKKGWAGIKLIPRTITLHSSGKQLLLCPIKEVETLRGNKVKLSNVMLVKGEKIEIEGITAAQADVEVSFSFNSLEKSEPFDPSWDRYDAQSICNQKRSTVQGGLGPFGLLILASENLEEYTSVFFRVFKAQNKHLVLMCSDPTRSTLKDGKGVYRPTYGGFVDVDLTDMKLSFRSLIDHLVIESFGEGGKIAITSRVYPILAIYYSAHLYAFNNGTEAVKIDNLNAWSMNKAQHMNQS